MDNTQPNEQPISGQVNNSLPVSENAGQNPPTSNVNNVSVNTVVPSASNPVVQDTVAAPVENMPQPQPAQPLVVQTTPEAVSNAGPASVSYSFSGHEGSKKTLLISIFVIILLIITGILVYILVLNKQPEVELAVTPPPVIKEPVPTATPTPALSEEEIELQALSVDSPDADLQNVDADLQQL